MAKSTEVKVLASAVVSAGAGALIAILNVAAADSELLGGLPPWLQFVIITLVPGVVAWLGGYVTPSPTSIVSTGYRNRPPAA
jgi:hypothetical protein